MPIGSLGMFSNGNRQFKIDDVAINYCHTAVHLAISVITSIVSVLMLLSFMTILSIQFVIVLMMSPSYRKCMEM